MTFAREDRVLWLANVRKLPFRERVETAGKGGYGVLSTSPADHEQIRATGLADADIRSIAADHGVKLSYLDPMSSWVPDGLPEDGHPDLIAYLDRTPDDFFRIADALQVDRIHLVGSFPEGRYEIDELVEYYARTCERAAAHGQRCLIEGMPLWGLKTLGEVWEIVRRAGQPNGGLIFDTWHYTRAGRDDALIAEIPVGVIDTVQVADGPIACPPERTMIEDCLGYRVPIGEGEVPNLEILRLLRNAGHLRSVGPEIFSHRLDELDGNAILAAIEPGLDEVLAAAA